MRYYDMALDAWCRTPGMENQVDVMKAAQVITADNVADYYWRGTDQDQWEWKDFPNIAPPFQVTWIEWKNPPFSLSKVRGVQPVWYDEAAILMCAMARDEGGWDIFASLFQDCRKAGFSTAGEAVMSVTYGVTKQGEICPASSLPNGNALMMWPCPRLLEYANRSSKNPQKVEQTLLDYTSSMSHVWFLTLSFMHCKNVYLEECVPDQKLVKKTLKHRGISLHRFKTLNIEPMKAILDSSMNGGQHTFTQALSICRGHFKDYRAHGLFGKNKGMYWWNAFARGSAESGTIEKQYDVHPSRITKGA